MAIKFLNHISKGRVPIFIDETGFNSWTLPICGYSKIGKSFIIKCPPQSPNTSVILAITDSTLLGFQLIQGSVTAQDFGGFICELLDRHYHVRQNIQSYFWVMDNATIHHASVLKDLFENFHVCYNAPYSPFLNPAEECFGLWKFNFRKGKINDGCSIFTQITRSSSILTNKMIKNFYRHSLSYFEDALKLNPIL
jgi:hypothetical protein